MLDEKDIALFKSLLDKQSETIHTDLMTVIEADVRPSLQLLAEGQQTIIERLVPMSRIETMEEEISALKWAVKYLSEKVNALERAH